MLLATQSELRGHSKIEPLCPCWSLILPLELEKGSSKVLVNKICQSFCSLGCISPLVLSCCFLVLFSITLIQCQDRKRPLWSSCYAGNVDSACSWQAVWRSHALFPGFVPCQYQTHDGYRRNTDLDLKILSSWVKERADAQPPQWSTPCCKAGLWNSYIGGTSLWVKSLLELFR